MSKTKTTKSKKTATKRRVATPEKQSEEKPLVNAHLKRRRAEAPAEKPVVKPRKMKLLKPKRQPEKTNDFANSSLLVFPSDPRGIATALKAELIRTGSRIGSDKADLALIKEVIAMGLKHIEARLTQNSDLPKLKRRVDHSVQVEPEKTEEETEESKGDE